MFEPRGHYDMYGALLVEPDLPGADLAVLFMHNEGYSTMCGHAIIALGRYAVDQGLVAKQEPITTVNIECPCGLVVASVEVSDGKAGAVSFESVPAFLFAGDQTDRIARLWQDRVRHRLWRRLLCAGRLPPVRPGIRPRPRARFRRRGDRADREAEGGFPAVASRSCRPCLPLRHDPDRRRRCVFRSPRRKTSASSPRPRSTARRPAPASPRGWRPCMPRARSASARRACSKASPARASPARWRARPGRPACRDHRPRRRPRLLFRPGGILRRTDDELGAAFCCGERPIAWRSPARRSPCADAPSWRRQTAASAD